MGSLLKQIISEKASVRALKESTNIEFRSDNPGGKWLQHKQEDAEYYMKRRSENKNHHTAGISGSVTGYFTGNLILPVKHIKNLEGACGEECYRGNKDNQKMEYLKSEIGSPEHFDSSKHPIFIAVNHKGKGYVMEGNHRLQYASDNGIAHIHAEVRYFNGGESVDGDMHPKKLLKLHQPLLESNDSYKGEPEYVEHPMIDVDGVQKHRHNSDGKPIHPTEEGIRNFHRWFGDSKMVDEHGRPQVFYHGTSKQFETPEFKQNERGIHFVSPSPDFANTFTGGESAISGGEHPTMMPLYLRTHNPFDYENKKHVNLLAVHASLGKSSIDAIKDGDWRTLESRTILSTIKKLGFDGIHVKERVNKNSPYVKNLGVFDSSNIKSAIGNDGTFDHPTKINESTEYPISERPDRKKWRKSSELSSEMTIDASKFKEVYEREQKEPLPWSKQRLRNLRSLVDSGTAIDALPEIGIDALGRIHVNDGRHRISHASELGLPIRVSLRPEDVEAVKEKLK